MFAAGKGSSCPEADLRGSAIKRLPLGGPPPLIQRYRISPLLSHSPCSGPDRGAGHETPRFHNSTRRRNGWMAIRLAHATEGDAGGRVPERRQRTVLPEPGFDRVP